MYVSYTYLISSIQQLPSRQERMADGQESFEGHGHRAVDASHEARLSDVHYEGQGLDPDELVVASPKFGDAEEVNGAEDINLKNQKNN